MSEPTATTQPPASTETTDTTQPTATGPGSSTSSTAVPATTSTTQTPNGTGTASLTLSGVVSGRLLDAVSHCQPVPDEQSQITVDGTLNGTPWALFVQSYDGESGVWQVLTGQAGGATGMTGDGYAATATYPATVPGVTVDWFRGATLDAVELASNSGQAPAGNVEVQGTISCQ
jgi:hypothetical protein